MIKNRKITNTFVEESDTQVAIAHISADPREKYLYDRIFLDSKNQKFHTLVSTENNKYYNSIPYNYVLTNLLQLDSNAVYDKKSESIIINKGQPDELLIDEGVFRAFTDGCYTRLYNTLTNMPFYHRYYVNNGDSTLNTWVWRGVDYQDTTSKEASKPFLDWIYFLLAGGLNEEPHEMSYDDYASLIASDWSDLKTNAQQQFYIICHWLADAYQEPLKTGDTALLFTGGQNIGKSSLVPLIGRIIDKGFGRSMEAKVFLSSYDDDFSIPGLIDISDTHEVAAFKFEASLRQKIRPSAGERMFNIKSRGKVQGRSHIRFITSSNDSDFVTMKKGETTRYHLIDCASVKSLHDQEEKYNHILDSMKEIITTQDFDKDTFNPQQQEYLSSISMFLDNIKVNQKLCQSSSGFETALMLKKVRENLSSLKMLLIEKYDVIRVYASRKNKDFTRILRVKELYSKIIEDDRTTEKTLSLPAFKKMLSDPNNSEYVNYDASNGRVSVKIIQPNYNEDGEIIEDNVIYIQDKVDTDNNTTTDKKISSRVAELAAKLKNKKD